MPEIEELKAAIERIHDIAEALILEPELPIRARQAFEEIISIAHHKPDVVRELDADGEGPFALGGGSIMDGKDILV